MLDKFKWTINSTEPKNIIELSKALNLSPTTCKILINRGIESKDSIEKFFSKDISHLEDPFSLKGMDKATSIILDAVNKRKKILIFGDYDVDGICGTALLHKAFNHLVGIEPSYYIPHRIEEGYGLSAEGIEFAHQEGVDLIITVDNGITAYEEIKLAKDKGMKVIITDHHEAGELPPPADAVINPKQKDCPYPNKELSGTGVAFKLVQAISQLLNKNYPEELIELAAIATIADSVFLTPENRILVRIGLDLINERNYPGINELLSVANWNKAVDNVCVLFVISPRLNAAGRLEKADEALKLLLAENKNEACNLANNLNKLNVARQNIEEKILKEIEIEFQKRPLTLEKNAIILSGEGWHLGVIGIISSRLCEKYNKPVFLATEINGILKGSARAPEGYNVYEMLNEAGNCLLRFGGHKKAAGFSIKREFFFEFENIIQKNAEKAPKLKPSLNIDAELSLKDINIKLAQELKQFEPFGPGNPEPLFLLRKINLKEARLVGKPPVHLKILMEKDNLTSQAIGFRKENYYQYLEQEKFYHDILFTLGIDTYSGNKNVALYIKDIKMPQKECVHVLKEPDKLLTDLKSDFPLILDARYLKNKEKYISTILKFSSNYLILVKDKEKTEKIKEFLKEPLKVIHSEIYWKDIDKFNSPAIEDIFFYDPPVEVEKFKSFKDASRIHLLFDQEDIKKLEKNIHLSFPTRETLILIYRHIVSNYDKTKKTKKEALVRNLNHPLISEETINAALIIFKELDILDIDFLNDELVLTPKPSEKKQLGDSKTYASNMELRKKFKETKKIINHPKLDLLKELL